MNEIVSRRFIVLLADKDGLFSSRKLILVHVPDRLFVTIYCLYIRYFLKIDQIWSM